MSMYSSRGREEASPRSSHYQPGMSPVGNAGAPPSYNHQQQMVGGYNYTSQTYPNNNTDYNRHSQGFSANYNHQAPMMQPARSPMQKAPPNFPMQNQNAHAENIRTNVLPPMPIQNTERLNTSALSSQGDSEFDKMRIETIRKNTLYEDPNFQASNKSIWYSRRPPFPITWMRPHEITRPYRVQPELFVRGSGRFDIKQGLLGDCWLLAALASVSEHKGMLNEVIPEGQSFQPGWYAGMFVFKFWRFGKWEEVIIDDRLPTDRGQLIFLHSGAVNEFWGALVEKAYAKLNGSYEALKGGVMVDSLTDLTGGMAESFPMGQSVPRGFVNTVFKALERRSIIGCGINPVPGEYEARLPSGLVAGHAYSITDLREIRLVSNGGEQSVTLVRVRNPWGNKVEWNGAWSDRSKEWNSIPKQNRDAMGLVFRDDGEFWLKFEDLIQHFDNVTICNMTPDSLTDGMRSWKTSLFHGSWSKGINAGGCPNYPNSFYANPQYRISLKDTDDDDDRVCSFVSILMQKDRRKMVLKSPQFLYIGFLVYEVQWNTPLPLSKSFFQYNGPVAMSDRYSNGRQVSKRLALRPGTYVIIPTTYEPNQEADFLLRLAFEKENDAEKPSPPTVVKPVNPVEPDPNQEKTSEMVKRLFYEEAGEIMEVDARQFRKILLTMLKDEPHHIDISISACQAMLSLVDNNLTGKLDFNEFMFLWELVRSWKKTFYGNDQNENGVLDTYELRTALGTHGYQFDDKTIGGVLSKYTDERGKATFDNFIVMMAKLMLLYEKLKRKKNEKNEDDESFLDWLISLLPCV